MNPEIVKAGRKLLAAPRPWTVDDFVCAGLWFRDHGEVLLEVAEAAQDIFSQTRIRKHYDNQGGNYSFDHMTNCALCAAITAYYAHFLSAGNSESQPAVTPTEHHDQEGEAP